jgi:hypothetical protein
LKGTRAEKYFPSSFLKYVEEELMEWEEAMGNDGLNLCHFVGQDRWILFEENDDVVSEISLYCEYVDEADLGVCTAYRIGLFYGNESMRMAYACSLNLTEQQNQWLQERSGISKKYGKT